MRVDDLFLAVPPSDERVYHIRLHRSRPEERYLRDHIIEDLRLKPA